MDSVISSVIGGIIEGYFSIFFKNFRKESFSLNTGTSETSSQLHNLEINTEVVQEILGFTSLEVAKMSIDTLTISLQPLNIRKVPITIRINRVDCLLNEPWTKLKPVPTVLEEFLKRLPGNKQSYGLSEKIIDGFTIIIDHVHVEVKTCGKYKLEEKGAWSPPPMHIDLRGIFIRTTNDRWEVVDLSTARDYNANLHQIYVFKAINVDSLRCIIHGDDGKEIPLIANIPVAARMVIRKEQNNALSGLSLEIILDHFHSTLKLEELHYFANVLKGIASCFGRRDKPQEAPVKIPHPAKIIGIQLRNLSAVILEQSGAGIEIIAKDIRIGNFWGPKSRRIEKEVEFCLGNIQMREFFARTGPSTHCFVDSDTNRVFTSPFKDIKPIERTFHLSYKPYTVEKPLIYFRAMLGDLPAFDATLLVNPIIFDFRPETVTSVVELVSRATPHIQEIQKLHNLKPEGIEVDNILVQEGKSPLEEIFHLQAKLHHISLSFPSAQSSDFVRVSLNLSDIVVLSHPKLSDSKLLQTGIGALPDFPGAEDDLVFAREQIKSSTKNLHSVKFRIDLQIEWTVQFAPDAPPQRALHMPKNTLDVCFSLGHLQNVQGDIKPKLEPILIEIGLGITEFNGQLNQLQYQAILSRIDQVLLLYPVIQKLSSVNTNIEKPKTKAILLFKVERGEWKLCNDHTVPNGDVNIEPLAGLNFHGIQLCVENSEKRQVVKFFVQNIEVNALPNPKHESKLFNPNSFIHTGSPNALLAVRFKNMNHEPGELLIVDDGDNTKSAVKTVRKYLGNRAFYDGERSNLDIRLTSLHSGINPNPACNIINFFLKSEINFQRIIQRLKEAKADLEKSLEKVDISAMASDFASDFKVDKFVETVKHSLDIDVRVDISDSRIYLVQDLPEDLTKSIHGDIGLQIDRILLDRHVESKYKHSSVFNIDNIDVKCNKEEGGIVSSKAIFSPVSCKFQSDRSWILNDKEWIMDVTGFFDKIDLEVTPSHAKVFIDVISGVKMDNIQKVINSVSEYANKAKTQLPSIRDQFKDSIRERLNDKSETLLPAVVIDEKKLEVDAILSNTEQLNGWITKAKSQLTKASDEYTSLNTAMQSLEERTGEADVIGQAKYKGKLQMLSGRRLVARYVAISKNGSLFVFQDEKGGKPQMEMKLDSTTQLAMIEKLKCGFQVQSGSTSLIFSAADEMDMTMWTNTILKLQVAGISDYENQTSDSFTQAQTCLEQIEMYTNRITAHAEGLKEQAKLIAKIAALEEMVRERDSEITKLKESQ